MNHRIFPSTISFLFHPMLISFSVFYVLIFGRGTVNENASTQFIVCFIFSNLIPIITVLILKKTGKISDLDASEKKQRIFPLTLGIIYSGIAFLLLTYLKADVLVRGLMFTYMTNTLLIISITKFWKISIHTMGVAGPIAVLWLAGFQFPLTAAIILISVSYSRVILKHHSWTQVIAGSVTGLVITYLQLILFMN